MVASHTYIEPYVSYLISFFFFVNKTTVLQCFNNPEDNVSTNYYIYLNC